MDMNSELVYKAVIETNWIDAEQWCIQFVGEWNIDWYKLGIDPAATIFGDNSTTWYFKDARKMAMFLLKWT